jgi:nitrite reductase (NADH) small subunit
MKYIICQKSDLKPGGKKLVTVENKSVVIVCTNEGQYYAVRNVCPHQGAELGLGNVSGTLVTSQVGEYIYGRDNEIIRCPWHGFEFEVKTGCSLHDKERLRVKTYDVEVEDDNIVIKM